MPTPSPTAVLRTLVVILLIASPLGAAAQDARPRILVTNDDGIGSTGIAAIVNELKTFADVVVVAPSENYSGGSHSSVIRTIRAELKPFYRDGELFGYGVNATPADAAKFGILHLGVERPFDLVVSGINAGANTGEISHSSGTVGAAMEALHHGIPAIATSQGAQQDYARSAAITARIVRMVLEEGLPSRVMLSINIPGGELRGIRAARMGGSYFGVGSFEEIATGPDSTSYRSVLRPAIRGGEDTDTAAYLDGFVTVTPLRYDWTDLEMLERLSGWDLRLDP
ncbi:MAG: 5'/3'-nucleotidase SurE [Gemmatimonadota bacterium]